MLEEARMVHLKDELEEFLEDVVHPLLYPTAAEHSSTVTSTERGIVLQALTEAAEWVRTLTEAGRLYQVSVSYIPVVLDTFACT